MDDTKILAMQNEINREYIDMAARLKAIEYIVRTSSSYIDVESLAIVLGIPVPKEDDD